MSKIGPFHDCPTGRVMSEEYSQPHAIVKWPEGTPIAGFFSDIPGGAHAAAENAAFFRLAANCHAELLAACEQAEAHLVELYRGIDPASDGRFANDDVSVTMLRAAIGHAKWGGVEGAPTHG